MKMKSRLLVFVVILSLILFSSFKSSLINAESDQVNIDTVENDAGKVPDLSGLAGGYAPKGDLIIGNYQVADFEIWLNKDGKAINKIFFLIKNRKNVKDRGFYNCLDFNVKDGKISFKTGETPVGVIEFSGTFLPAKNGDYWLVSWSTPVLIGKLEISKNKKLVYSNQNQEFTYLIGE